MLHPAGKIAPSNGVAATQAGAMRRLITGVRQSVAIPFRPWKTFAALLLPVAMAAAVAIPAHAEDGYDLWLRYRPTPSESLRLVPTSSQRDRPERPLANSGHRPVRIDARPERPAGRQRAR